MLDPILYYLPIKFANQFTYVEFRKKIAKIMGQFIDYLTSIFTVGRGQDELANEKSTGHHVTFADNSFTQAFNRGSSETSAKLNSLRQSNRKTIITYQFIVFLTYLIHFSWVTWPRIQQDTFALAEPEGWQLVTLNLVPLVVQVAAICAMAEINKPIPEGTKITSKNSGLELDNNDFISSLKGIIILMAACQLSALVSELLLWSVIMIVPFWCFLLTSKLAQNEYERHAPSPRKQWVKLNIKSPKVDHSTNTTPKKTAQASKAKRDTDTKATPRTRTKKAVKNFFDGVSDRYHTLEQNVAHQLSQKIFNPLSPRTKMIEPK